MYFDVDYIDEKPLSELFVLSMVRILQQFHYTSKGTIYVTQCISYDSLYSGRTKTGLHIICNGASNPTSVDEAIYFRNIYVELLNEQLELPNKQKWDSVIDSSVYGESRGIRMLGSRKMTRGIDMGHLYELLFIVDEQGEIMLDEPEPLELMVNNSIHLIKQ
jgi:hypothetical protein